jgi:hypothetical protein
MPSSSETVPAAGPWRSPALWCYTIEHRMLKQTEETPCYCRTQPMFVLQATLCQCVSLDGCRDGRMAHEVPSSTNSSGGSVIQGGGKNPSNGCETQTKNELYCCLSTGELPEYIIGRERNMLQARRGMNSLLQDLLSLSEDQPDRKSLRLSSDLGSIPTVCLQPSPNPPSCWAVAISFSLVSPHRIFK